MRNELKTLDSPLDHLSDNHVIRFLASLQWDFTKAFEYIKNAEKLRKDYECTVLTETEFTDLSNQKAFVFSHNYDRMGHPILWIKLSNWTPSVSDEK